jgi:DNA-binding NarL/FixJ family response regulator
MEKIKVVIVDDHEIVRKSINELLNQDSRFWVLDLCCNGEEAIISAQEKNPDVIIMDLKMSPVNGFEAIQKILAHNPHMKILVHSFENECIYHDKVIQMGARGFLTKGTDIDELFEALICVYNGNIYISREICEMKS